MKSREHVRSQPKKNPFARLSHCIVRKNIANLGDEKPTRKKDRNKEITILYHVLGFRGRDRVSPQRGPSLEQDSLKLLVCTYVYLRETSPTLLNIANLLAEKPMFGTTFHVFLIEVPSQNEGTYEGTTFPQEHIQPAKT